MKKLFFILCAFWILVAFAHAQTNWIYGNVTDAGMVPQKASVTRTLLQPNPKSFSGYWVKPDPLTIQTDESGHFCFSNCVGGQYEFDISGSQSAAMIGWLADNFSGSNNVVALASATNEINLAGYTLAPGTNVTFVTNKWTVTISSSSSSSGLATNYPGVLSFTNAANIFAGDGSRLTGVSGGSPNAVTNYSQIQTPATIPGLYAWFDASQSFNGLTNGASITAWPDILGNRPLTGGAAFDAGAMGGKPAVYFNTSSSLGNANLFNQSAQTNITCFIVVRNGLGGGYTFTSGHSGGANCTVFNAYNSGNSYGINIGEIGYVYGFQCCSDDISPSNTFPQVVAFQQNSTAGNMWINERIAVASATKGDAPTGPWATNNFVLGNPGFGGITFDGYVSEVIFYTNFLSQAQVAIVSDYLCRKYNRKNPSIVLDGDSVMSSYGSGYYQTLASLLHSKLVNWEVETPAYFGYSVANNTNDLPYWVKSQKPANNILIIKPSQNGVANSPSVVPAVEAQLTYELQTARANGMRTLLMTMPSIQSEMNSSWWTNLNTWITTNWQNVADGVIDTTADPLIGVAGCYTNTTYFQFNSHWTAAMNQYLVNNYIYPAIQNLLAPQNYDASKLTNTVPLASLPSAVVTNGQHEIVGDVGEFNSTIIGGAEDNDIYFGTAQFGFAGNPVIDFRQINMTNIGNLTTIGNLTVGGTISGNGAVSTDNPPYNAGTNSEVVVLDRANGIFQMLSITNNVTLDAPLGGSIGKELRLWLLTNNTNSLTMTNISLPSDSGLTWPKTLVSNTLYVILLKHTGTKWMLNSLVGGY